jgi:hypothetical protein
MSDPRIARIRELNDLLRHTGMGGAVVWTTGVHALGPDALLQIAKAVETFDSFDEGNDPYGEHDFGAFEAAGKSLFWKIDYYDPTLTAGSEDPADPQSTCRVLTVMLAEEY